MVRIVALALGVIGALGLATGPAPAFEVVGARAEVFSALATGVVLILVAFGAKRTTVGKD